MTKYIVPLSLLILTSCYYDKEDKLYPAPTTVSGSGCDTSNISYASDIKPIFDKSCAISGCHDATSNAAAYNFSDYTNSVAGAGRGRLLGTINHAPSHSPMPKNMAKLTDCEIKKVTAWLNAGTPQ